MFVKKSYSRVKSRHCARHLNMNSNPDQDKHQLVEQLYRLYRDEMQQLAVSIVHDDEVAKDCVAEVFAWLSVNSPVVMPEKWRAYLLSSVRNRCRDYLAHRQVEIRARHDLAHEGQVTEIDDVVGSDAGEAISRAEREMTPRTHQVFLMRYEEQKSYREISKALGISIPAVYKHMLKARRKITARLVGVAVSLLVAVVAVAIGIGIARHRAMQKPASEPLPVEQPAPTEKAQMPASVTFENQPLAEVLSAIAAYHHLKLDIRNEEAARQRLYFRWNQAEPLTTTLESLNRSDRFHVTLSDDGCLVVE